MLQKCDEIRMAMGKNWTVLFHYSTVQIICKKPQFPSRKGNIVIPVLIWMLLLVYPNNYADFSVDYVPKS